MKTWLRAQWDRVLGAVGVAGGLLGLLLGYRGVANTPYPAEQIPFVVSGGVLGIALIGIGLTAWLSADLRDEWRKLDRIERRLEQQSTAPPVGATAAPAAVPAPTADAADVGTSNVAGTATASGNGHGPARSLTSPRRAG